MKIAYILSGSTFCILACVQAFWKDFEEMGYFFCMAFLCLALTEAINIKNALEFQIKNQKLNIDKLKESKLNSNQRFHI
ncbi:MAG: hypothetical protein V3V74_07590 [Nitrosomonadaceae bacterium]